VISPSSKSLTFQTELALWSQNRHNATVEENEHKAESSHQGTMDSGEGRREGWLAPPEPAATSRVRSTREISMELSRVSNNEPWENIWDGKKR
jgi:hypothetical protein